MSKRVAKYLTPQMRPEEMKAYYTDRRLFQSPPQLRPGGSDDRGREAYLYVGGGDAESLGCISSILLFSFSL